MSTPSLILSFLISTLLGVAFHLFRGGGAGKLLLFLFLAWFGFAAGQLLAERQGWSLFSVGSVHLGVAVPVALAFLLLGNWLSLTPRDKKSKTIR